MTTQARTQPLVQITDPDFQAGFEEAQEPYYADCGIQTDMGLVEIVRASSPNMLWKWALRATVTTEHRLYHRHIESKLVFSFRYLGTLPGYPYLRRSTPL